MKEHKLFVAMFLTLGLALAPVTVLAQEEKGEEGSQSAPHDANGDHAHEGGKATKKADSPKAQAASGKTAIHSHGDHDGDEEEEEGSH